MRKSLIVCGGLALAVVTAAATIWQAPPLRLAAPGFFGAVCSDRVCAEHGADLDEAKALFAAASSAAQSRTGLAIPALNVVMCRSNECYRSFGGGTERAISFPYLGTVIAGRSWQDYIVHHELVHWLQFEHFGAFQTMGFPVWFREGMAYALSGAPDWDIPEAFKPWMAQFREWQSALPVSDIFATQPVFD